MLIAMGMTLVIATRGIDISVGATVAISNAIAAALIGGSLEKSGRRADLRFQTPMALAILAALGVGLLCGLWNGFLVAGIGMRPIIATLILMVGRARHCATDHRRPDRHHLLRTVFFFNGFSSAFRLPSTSSLLSPPCCCCWYRTALGLFIQAVGLNPTAARFSGISARMIFWFGSVG